jgi:hypothetical protein
LLFYFQVCDHPALLSDKAAKLVIRGGNRLATGRADSSDSEDDFISCSSDEDSSGDGDESDGEVVATGEKLPLSKDASATGEDWWTWGGNDIQAS